MESKKKVKEVEDFTGSTIDSAILLLYTFLLSLSILLLLCRYARQDDEGAREEWRAHAPGHVRGESQGLLLRRAASLRNEQRSTAPFYMTVLF